MDNHEQNVTGSLVLPVSNYVTRVIKIPNDLAYIMAFNGALVSLGKSTYWQQIDAGDQTPEEAAIIMRDLLDTMTDEIPMTVQLGSVQPGLFSTPPTGWLLMNGANYAMADYPDLMAVYPLSLQNSPSSGRFVVPDMTGRSMVGSGTGYTSLAIGGAATHTLTIAEMPSHNHTINMGNTNGSDVRSRRSIDSTTGTLTGSTGGGGAHNNLPPYRVIPMYLIALNV